MMVSDLLKLTSLGLPQWLVGFCTTLIFVHFE